MNVASRPLRRTLGALTWAALLFACAGWALLPRTSNSSSPDRQGPDSRNALQRYWGGAFHHLTAEDETGAVRRYDPVFRRQPTGQWQQVGYVSSIHGNANARSATIAWYGGGADPAGCRLSLYRNRGRLSDVLAMMLPESKRERIRRRLADLVSRHGEEMTARFAPLVERSFRESMPILEKEWQRSLERHRDEIDRLAGRFQREVVAERLIPLAREEVLPIVRRHGREPAESIGRELWDRASIWRFGWRAVYDKSPLPRRDLVREEWDRFIEEEAIPVLEAHLDEMAVAVQRTLSDIAANPAVRSELTDVAVEWSGDPEARALLNTILRETFVENERLRQHLREIWTSPEAEQALAIASERMEPVIRQIGDELFGSRETGIDPNFARVLRNQVLGKDRRWLVVTCGDPSDLNAPTGKGFGREARIVIREAGEVMPYPVVHLAAEATGAGR